MGVLFQFFRSVINANNIVTACVNHFVGPSPMSGVGASPVYLNIMMLDGCFHFECLYCEGVL